jgi:DNA-binding response OmpR family regulator
MRNVSLRWNGNQRHAYLATQEVATTPPRVLIAEDDEAMRALLADALRDWGFEVVEAGDGAKALDNAVVNVLSPGFQPPFDVLLLDECMPLLTGLEVLEQLRETALGPSVIIMSEFISDEMFAQADRLGGVTIVRKPFPLEQLIDIVSDAAQERYIV